MPEPAIVATHLRKEYVIHTHQATTIKEMVLKNLFVPGEKAPFIALRDVSFTLERGQSMAVVGANGSGKSTLLKLIAGITQPDSGELAVNGKVAALLELGAGFQHELTGMENIFLQCSILGLSREQILERLESIMEFADLDAFIHTPVKRYSSGMYMRLAFAIAFHVDADIILLDEVLAVGDQAFQIKCKAMISSLRRAGKSVLFVSHILEQVRTVADMVLWLEKGEVVAFGRAEELLPRFYESLLKRESSTREEVTLDMRTMAALPLARHAAKAARITDAKFLSTDGEQRHAFSIGEKVIVRIDVDVAEALEGVIVICALATLDSMRAAWVDSGSAMLNIAPGRYRFEATIEDHHLAPGLYLASFGLVDQADIRRVHDLILRMNAISFYEEGKSAASPDLPDVRLSKLGSFVS
ncbi:ABC transporter ATP-binding protein [soil metagenome]